MKKRCPKAQGPEGSDAAEGVQGHGEDDEDSLESKEPSGNAMTAGANLAEAAQHTPSRAGPLSCVSSCAGATRSTPPPASSASTSTSATFPHGLFADQLQSVGQRLHRSDGRLRGAELHVLQANAIATNTNADLVVGLSIHGDWVETILRKPTLFHASVGGRLLPRPSSRRHSAEARPTVAEADVSA